MRNAIALGLLALFCCCSVSRASDKARLETVANVSAIAPGQPFMLGFKFSIEPGWHIYWKNPGDSGLPTEVKLNLPEGFTAGELLFPVPTRLQLPGNIVNYAYENQVMLMVRVTPPKDLPVGKSVAIAGKVSWLVCQDECRPGKAEVSIQLPVVTTATPANEDLFKLWTSQLPVKKDVEDIASLSHAMALSNGDGQGSIDIGWKNVPSDVQYIPGPLKSGDVSDVKAVTTADSTKIAFSIKSFKNDEPVTGLVVFTPPGGAGAVKAVEISIPYGAGGPR